MIKSKLKHKNEAVTTQLKEELHRLSSIIALLPGNIYWKNSKGEFLGCNLNVAKILHFNSPDDIIGKTNHDLFHKELADITSKIDEMVMSNNQEYMLEEPGLDINGNPATYLTRKIPLHDETGQVNGLLGVSFDITDRKKAEEQEKLALAQVVEAKASAKAEAELRQAIMVLSGSIAHGLRTPISTIEMHEYSLKKFWLILEDAYQKAKSAQLPIKEITPRQWELLNENKETITKTAREMHDFIDVTLKTLSQVLRGELAQKDLVLCSIWHCIHNILQRYPFLDKERELVHWRQQANFEFMGNEILMIRVLSNLLSNSLSQVRRNQRGEIFITTEDAGSANILRFKDTAGGAAPEIVNHLFDGYHTTKKEGTGIGLAFCKLTMKSLEGDITCHSVHGDYIEFVLTFPKILAK